MQSSHRFFYFTKLSGSNLGNNITLDLKNLPVIEWLNFIQLYTCKFRVGSNPGASFLAYINVETRDNVPFFVNENIIVLIKKNSDFS